MTWSPKDDGIKCGWTELGQRDVPDPGIIRRCHLLANRWIKGVGWRCYYHERHP